jgi:uncharacterized protein (DUF433 family)
MATKSQPFSIRLSAPVEAFIEREAKRTRRSRGSVLESLVEEALRMRRFPGIAFRGEDWDRRPWVIGTAFDVWQIVDAYRQVGDIEEIVAGQSLNERQVRLALAYADSYPEEIEEAIAQNRRLPDQLSRDYPFIETMSVDV